jgi:hypothetical protein
MATEKSITEHLWVGACGCSSDVEKPGWKPWFYRPQWYWYGWKTLLPISLGGDEWCRRDLVLGVSITGRVIIPLPLFCQGCEGCPRNTSELDDYLNLSREIGTREKRTRKARAKRIKKATRK